MVMVAIILVIKFMGFFHSKPINHRHNWSLIYGGGLLYVCVQEISPLKGMRADLLSRKMIPRQRGKCGGDCH